MGFFLQLRIILWKNLTLKKRKPLVLMFELFIPLVLFVILLAIRKKQPAHRVGASHFRAQPLPSAGVMAIMQAFCDGGQKNEHGFVDFPNSTAYNFLETFNQVAKDNNFFDPSFSLSDMDDLPDLYQTIIEDPASLHDSFMKAKDFNVSLVITNKTAFEDFLLRNLSIPQADLNVLTQCKINVTEVYRILFGSYPAEHAALIRKRRSIMDGVNDVPALDSLVPVGSDNGIVYRMLRDDPSLLTDPAVASMLGQLLGFKPATQPLDPDQLAEVLSKMLFSTPVLEDLVCDQDELTKVLIPPSPDQKQNLVDTQAILCNMTEAQWKELSDALNMYVNTTSVVEQLDLQDTNLTVAHTKVVDFSFKLHEFLLFEKNMMELSAFASKLPQDACASEEVTTVTPHIVRNVTETNGTASEDSTLGPAVEVNTATQKTSDTSSSPGGGRGNSPQHGLVQLWTAMQTTVCGKPAISKDKMHQFSQSQDLNDLGLTGKQKYDLGILIHVLYNNPKVLYSPNDTEADTIIRKANETFALFDEISRYASKWLNVSMEIREYLLKNTTENNLDSIREMHQELRAVPGLDALVNNNPTIKQFVSNSTVPHTSFFLKQLDVVDRAACSWKALLHGISLNVFQGFGTEDELIKYAMNQAYHDNLTVLAGVVFTNMRKDGSLPPHIIYKIRQNATFTRDTRHVRPPYWFPGPMSWGYKYYQFGFVWIQDIMERAIINIFADRNVIEPGSYVHEFPYPCYMNDQFLFMIEHVMPLCLTISWVYTVAMLVENIVHEKEHRLKEVMKMMGLNNSVHWVAWFLTTFVQMSISMGVLTAMLKYGNVLQHSNALVIFLVLEIFAIATISFSFLVSVLYSKARLAAACAGIVYFLTYVPYMYVAIREEAAGDKIPAWAKSIASLFSTTAFGLGAKYFAFYEIEGVGVQWNNIYISPVESDQYNLFNVIIMMVIDTLLYGLLTWYIENVHPGSYGLPKPWYFPFTQSYWFGHTRTESEQCSWRRCCRRSHANMSVMEEEQACAMAQEDCYQHTFEPDPTHLPLGVVIDNLTKVYKTGKLAVKKLSLNLYEGQIMSFLGHNGAGKTTTMSILTGLFPPTSGYATIYGHDIRSDMEEIRKSLGMCPQHNVLFDKLTVEEHLWFYAKLKGLSDDAIKVEMETMIQDVGLPNKRNVCVDCLSGGMKRKLSVAIAFVSGSRTVILDEPTAGVDPYARRAIWDLLIKYKEGRTILLSTHHMDEADILGDRIAIINNGQLQCCGTSLFLKSTYGEGYHLSLVKKPADLDVQSTDTLNQDELNSSQVSFHSKCSETKVTSFIAKYVSTAYLTFETLQELGYILPFEEAKKGGFEKLFAALDSNLDYLDITSYGVEDTSLEEVFLKVTEQAQGNAEALDKANEKLLSGVTTALADGDVPDQSSILVDDQDVELTTIPASRRGRHSRQSSDVSILLGRGHSRQNSDGSITSPKTHSRNNSDVPLLFARGHSRQNSDSSRGHARQGSDVSLIFARGHSRQSSDSSCNGKTGHARQGSDVPLLGRGHARQGSTGSASLLLTGSTRPDKTRKRRNSDSSSPPSLGHSRQNSDVPLLDNMAGVPPEQPSIPENEVHKPEPPKVLEGCGSYRVQGHLLLLQQFFAVIKKRYVYIRRNWKGLFSQILLPALFVCVAMTVALTAPQVQDQPPVTLSPAQYFNYTQPRGNFIPYANVEVHGEKEEWSLDASTQELIQTFRLPCGVSATCVLKTPYNSSFDEAMLRQLNFTYRNYKLLEKYFEPSCETVFQKGLTLENFVPPPPTAPPSDTINKVMNKTGKGKKGNPGHSSIRFYPDCHCASDGTSYICDKTSPHSPPTFQVVTSDIIQDITGQDESEYYLHTTDMYRLHRYGGFSFGNERDFVPKDFGKEAPPTFRQLAVRKAVKIWYNHKGLHAMPVYINAINNAILRANLPKERGNPAAYGITLINHPINNTDHLKTIDYIMQGSDVLIAIFIIVAMSFVPASFVLFLVYERSIKAKHLQFVCGINRIIYWLANYTWDMCNYLIPGVCCIIILKGFDIPTYTSSTNFPAVVALFLMYGWSITPMMYPSSFFFNEPSTAYIFLIVINLFVGITCVITSFLLEIFQRNDADLREAHEVLKNVFLVFPNYCLGRGLMDVAFNEYQNEYYFKTGQYAKMKSPFEWELVSRNLVAMAVMGLSFFFITLLCEYNFCIGSRRLLVNPLASPANEDPDVAAERKRVTRGSGRRDLIRLDNLTKIYKTRNLGRHLAVDRLCLGVPQGECFGLLGVNGAGKTTTFKMLTGDLPPSGGDSFLNGHSILKDLGKVQQNLGYCPQFDALYDELSAREHLYLYASLRGVPYHEQKTVVDWALAKLDLTLYADKMSGTYSGGNKRKLSTAIALIGHPPVIFLDEPTTGMDPHSRRFLWDLIIKLVRGGRSVILTSHSMEECEVLCTRLAIMVNGQFKCLGSAQHLKSRFGDGYTVSLRVKGPNYEREVRSIIRYMQRHFPLAVLKEQHHNMVQYELGSEGLSLSRLFARMEEAQHDLQVEDYSVSQNNLDNVFINFVKQQVEIVREPEDGSLSHSLSSSSQQELQPMNSSSNSEENLDSADEESVRIDQAGSRLSFLGMEMSNC